MSDFERARRDWDLEVDREAAKLVEEGVPPFDAIERARNTVTRRRREAARERELTPKEPPHA